MSTDRAVTFNGQQSVTLVAGAELLSDPVTLPVTALSNIAVTMYFASPSVLSTVHALGRQTAYIGAGNQLSAASIPSATADQRQSYYGLSKGEAFCAESVNAQREIINTWIRNNRDIDTLVDFDRPLQNPADPATINPIYDSGDHLHPNDAGYGVMAATIDLARLQ